MGSDTFFEVAHGTPQYAELLRHLPPQVLDIGSPVWWPTVTGELYEGRIRKIAVGYYSSHKPENACRRYAAQSVRMARTKLASSEIEWHPSTYEWRAGFGFVHEPDYLWPVRVDFDRACEEAAKNYEKRAAEARRHAELYDGAAANLRLLSPIEEFIA